MKQERLTNGYRVMKALKAKGYNPADDPGNYHTYNQWLRLGRQVRKGEKAINVSNSPDMMKQGKYRLSVFHIKQTDLIQVAGIVRQIPVERYMELLKEEEAKKAKKKDKEMKIDINWKNMDLDSAIDMLSNPGIREDERLVKELIEYIYLNMANK